MAPTNPKKSIAKVSDISKEVCIFIVPYINKRRNYYFKLYLDHITHIHKPSITNIKFFAAFSTK